MQIQLAFIIDAIRGPFFTSILLWNQAAIIFIIGTKRIVSMVGVFQLLVAFLGLYIIYQMEEILGRFNLVFGSETNIEPPNWFVNFVRILVGLFVLYQLRLAFIKYI